MMNITTVGVDLAKDVITVCAQDGAGRMVDGRDLRPAAFASWLAQLPAGCVVGMEACSSAHHWARTMRALGLEPRIMAAEFVQPFRKSRAAKNDRNDAEAIAIAVRQAKLRFVAVKTVEQQARLTRHRLREGWKEERTALINRLRGVLAEFGLRIPRSAAALRRAMVEVVHDEKLPLAVREMVTISREHLALLDLRIHECDRAIAAACRQDPAAQRVQAVSGVGVLTADATTASVGDAREFKNGRQFAAWIGLAPRQYSSGGKTKLGGITRRGDAYLRTLLVQGARSTLQQALKADPPRASRLQQWVVRLYGRAGYHKTLIAIANKHARMLWVLLAKGENYDANAWQRYAGETMN
jgi:transposase